MTGSLMMPERCGFAGWDARRHRHPANFALGPAHAHLRLIGGVLLFLLGLYLQTGPGRGDRVPDFAGPK
jgi:hypothetical protein